MKMLTLDKFEEASEKVKEVTLETKLVYSDYLSDQTGNKVYLKPENMQFTGAYKVRGAYYKISTLSEEERQRGLITASAGNHAQGVAYAAKCYGCKAVIVMPTTTPLIDQLTSSYGVTEAQIEAAAKWQDTLDEFGEMKKIEDDTFEVTKSGKTLTTDMTIKFAKKDVNFEVVYDYYSMDVTGISVDPIYTLGEKMEKAGLNTVISMAVVFAVLILISLLISCFKIFPYLEKKKAAKAAGQAPQQEETPAAAPAPAPVAAQTDDTELIAVIAAAIAASTGTSTSDFVVRSINRR